MSQIRSSAPIAPSLESRLERLYTGRWSPGWLSAVNAQRIVAGFQPGRGLYDHRFTLAVSGHEEGTRGWADDRWRRLARELQALANRAAHDEALSDRDVERAVAIARQFRAAHDAVGQDRRSHPYAPPSNAEQVSGKSAASTVIRNVGTRIGKQRRERTAAQQRWLAAAQRWATMSPGDAGARHSYAQALLASGDHDLSVERAGRLLLFLDQQWPDNHRDPSALFYRAGALLCLDRVPEAVALARQAVDADDTLRGAWALLAWASTMALGDYQTGEMAARRLLREDPDNDWAKYMLSEALSAQGRNDEAAALYSDT